MAHIHEPPPCPPPGSLLTRYREGEHREVWTQLHAAGDNLGAAWREEAAAVADETMRRVQRNAARIRGRLQALKWPLWEFTLPDEVSDTGNVIGTLGTEVGQPLPPALVSFWTVVNSIVLMTEPDVGVPVLVQDIEMPLMDPLVVDPVRGALLYDLDEWLEAQRDVHPAIADPFDLPIAPDRYQKAHYSGGGPYAVALPHGGADPIVLYEGHDLPFTDYLRFAFEWGGFPGLEEHRGRPDVLEFIAGLTEGLEPF
jgi:hypothetical protein